MSIFKFQLNRLMIAAVFSLSIMQTQIVRSNALEPLVTLLSQSQDTTFQLDVCLLYTSPSPRDRG